MNEKIQIYKRKIIDLWGGFSRKTKSLLIGTFLVTLFFVALFIFLNSNSSYADLYTDLSPSEAGEIKTEIEKKGIPVQVSADGKTIRVPKEEVANLKVGLAAEGIPQSGNVNYSVFSENMGLGMTDRHFDVVERDAMQNELAYLIRQIEGVTDANVMITLPKETVWVTDEQQVASASVVLQGDPTFQLNQKQINGLYHLISKSIPDLPPKQIVIMDQHGQVYDMQEENQLDTTLSIYRQQRAIQQDIEQDIQRELQQMLGLLLGRDKVVVSVMVNMDFTKEKREENLVEPVDDEANEGIDISVERIVETYSGEGLAGEGDTGAGEGEIANYPGVEGLGNSESERTEERINREVNHIQRQIESSPYLIDDMTINVGVEPPDPDNPVSLTAQNIEDIRNILRNTVSTSLSMSGNNVTEQALNDRISVFATTFQGKPTPDAKETEVPWLEGIPNHLLLAIAAGVVLLLVALLVIVIILASRLRKRKRGMKPEDFEMELLEGHLTSAASQELEDEAIDLSELDSKANPKRKTIEKLAKERPEDFAKLLRSWMADD